MFFPQSFSVLRFSCNTSLFSTFLSRLFHSIIIPFYLGFTKYTLSDLSHIHRQRTPLCLYICSPNILIHLSTLVYYLNSSSVFSSSACFGSLADHGQPCHGLIILAVPSLGSTEVSVLAVLSLGSAVVSSWPCRVSIRLFSRFPRKEGQY